MTTRDTAKASHERQFAEVVELDLDTCLNTYGVAPCTAAAGTGNECYNTFTTCQDRNNFARGVRTIKLCSRGFQPPVGETIRPYVTDVNVVATEIVPSKGLAMRGTTTVSAIDEDCPDHLDDPYAATRAAPAGGTFWSRLLARNKNTAGRPARVRRGFVVAPFDWATFQTELYIITAVASDRGKVRLTLQDPTKLLDATRLPPTTDGKLTVALADIASLGIAQAGGASTITLASKASAVDDAYNGMEIYLTENTGAGQRRVITDYVGATRVATVSSAWVVTPDTTSQYEVSALDITLATGKGAQYDDPATSGKQEYVRIGNEVIRYTAKSGDVLSWPDSSYRAQFGSAREDHRVNDQVQLCRAFVAQTPAAVIESLLNEGGLTDAQIDLAGLATETGTWLSSALHTVCLSSPESISALLADLLIDLNASMWWDAVAQQARFKANMPEISVNTTLTDDDFLADSLRVERLDKERLTSQSIYYALRDATADLKKTESYQRAALTVDTDAESANEYGDQRNAVRLSRWLTEDNDALAAAWTNRILSRLRDAPHKFKFRLDPRNEVSTGQLVTISTRDYVDAAGAPLPVIVRIVKTEDQGTHQEVEALATNFTQRFAYIAPAGLPDYAAADINDRLYAYIADGGTGKMPNGDNPYLII